MASFAAIDRGVGDDDGNTWLTTTETPQRNDAPCATTTTERRAYWIIDKIVYGRSVDLYVAFIVAVALGAVPIYSAREIY